MATASILATLQQGLQKASVRFDHVEVCYVAHHLLGIRVADSRVCRENVLRNGEELFLTGFYEGRTGRKSLLWQDADGIAKELNQFHRELASASPDPECVVPAPQQGEDGNQAEAAALMDTVNIEELYQGIGKGIAAVKAQGLRLTGYVEIQKRDVTKVCGSGFVMRHSDSGAQISFTVDDWDNGLSGVGYRSLGMPSLQHGIGEAVQSAIREAQMFCTAGGSKRDVPAGDYDVILTPAAVYDILKTMLFYGFLDQRKIDEGRTYLSHNQPQFSKALQLSVGGTHPELAPDPLRNGHSVPCQPMQIMGEGQIQDAFISPFWAKKTHRAETFEPHFLPAIDFKVVANSPHEGIDLYSGLEAMIAATERGLLVVDTWYLRLVTEMDGMITGMTRDGLLLVEDGKIVAPLGHLRWHENPFKVWQRISGATTEQRLCGLPRRAGQARGSSALVPALRVKDFHFSSATKF